MYRKVRGIPVSPPPCTTLALEAFMEFVVINARGAGARIAHDLDARQMNYMYQPKKWCKADLMGVYRSQKNTF